MLVIVFFNRHPRIVIPLPFREWKGGMKGEGVRDTLNVTPPTCVPPDPGSYLTEVCALDW